MKKLLLTGFTVAFFSLGIMAQVQDRDTTSTRDRIEKDMEEAEETTEEGVEQTGEEIEEGAKETSDAVRQGAEKTGEAVEQAGEKVQKRAEKTGEILERDEERDDVEGTTSETEGAAVNNVEVLEDKEGPEGQVVYKHNDELFYIDREEQKIVKVKESELQEAKHEVLVKRGDSQSDEKDTKSKMKDKKKADKSKG